MFDLRLGTRTALLLILATALFLAPSLAPEVWASSYGNQMLIVVTPVGDFVVAQVDLDPGSSESPESSESDEQRFAVFSAEGKFKREFFFPDLQGYLLGSAEATGESFWTLELEDATGEDEKSNVLRRRGAAGEILAERALGGAYAFTSPEGLWALVVKYVVETRKMNYERMDLTSGKVSPLVPEGSPHARQVSELDSSSKILPAWNGDFLVVRCEKENGGCEVHRIGASGELKSKFALPQAPFLLEPLSSGGLMVGAFQKPAAKTETGKTEKDKGNAATLRKAEFVVYDAVGKRTSSSTVEMGASEMGNASPDGSRVLLTNGDGFLRLVELESSAETRLSAFQTRPGESWDEAQKNAFALAALADSKDPAALLDVIGRLSGPVAQQALESFQLLGAGGLAELLRRLAAEPETYYSVFGTVLSNNPDVTTGAVLEWLAAGNDFPAWMLTDVDDQLEAPSPLIEKAANRAIIDGNKVVSEIFHRPGYRLEAKAVTTTVDYMSGDGFDPSACSPLLGLDGLLQQTLPVLAATIADVKSPLRPNAIAMLGMSRLEDDGTAERQLLIGELRALARNDDPRVARAAVSALENSSLPMDRAAYLERLAADDSKTEEFARYLVEEARRQPQTVAALLPYVRRLAETAYDLEKRYAISTLARGGIPEFSDVLLPLTVDPYLDQSVRAGLASGLFRLVTSADRDVLWLAHGMAEGEPSRSMALRRLLELEDAGAVKELRSLLTSADPERAASAWRLAVEHPDPSLRAAARVRLRKPEATTQEKAGAISLLALAGPEKQDRALLVGLASDASMGSEATLALARLGQKGALAKAIENLASNRVPEGLGEGKPPGLVRLFQSMQREALPLLLAQARADDDAGLTLWILDRLQAPEVPDLLRVRLSHLEAKSDGSGISSLLPLAKKHGVDPFPLLAHYAEAGSESRSDAMYMAASLGDSPAMIEILEGHLSLGGDEQEASRRSLFRKMLRRMRAAAMGTKYNYIPRRYDDERWPFDSASDIVTVGDNFELF